jgi:transcription antitermination factor NusG
MDIQRSSADAPQKTWREIAASGIDKFWQDAARAPAWYVVEAVPDKEFELAVSLNAAFAAFGDDAQVLHLVEVRRWKRRVVANGQLRAENMIRKSSRFGPLLFVRVTLTRGLCAALTNMPFAHSVLRCKDGERPVVISDAIIEFYKGIASDGHPFTPTDIQVGDTVRIIEGPASGSLGIVERVDSGRALRLDTSKFGGLAPLFIEARRVELVVSCRKPRSSPDARNQVRHKPS